MQRLVAAAALNRLSLINLISDAAGGAGLDHGGATSSSRRQCCDAARGKGTQQRHRDVRTACTRGSSTHYARHKHQVGSHVSLFVRTRMSAVDEQRRALRRRAAIESNQTGNRHLSNLGNALVTLRNDLKIDYYSIQSALWLLDA